MNYHSFTNRSNYEHSQFSSADEFYKSKFPCCLIKRWDYNEGVEARRIQQADIDLTIAYVGFNGLPETCNISEKHRTEDWDDMFIELYSKYDQELGWSLKSKADKIAYFTPRRVMIVVENPTYKRLVGDLYNELVPKIKEKYEHYNKLNKSWWNFETEYKGRKVLVKRVVTNENGKTWDGIGVCVKWKDLKDFGLIIGEYKR